MKSESGGRSIVTDSVRAQYKDTIQAFVDKVNADRVKFYRIDLSSEGELSPARLEGLLVEMGYATGPPEYAGQDFGFRIRLVSPTLRCVVIYASGMTSSLYLETFGSG